MRLSGKLKQIAPVVALLLLIGAVVLMIVQYLRRDNDYQAAQKALDRRDFRAASVLLKRWLSGHPRDRDALLLAAQTSRRRGSLDEARYYLEECERQGSRSEGVAREQRLLRLQQGHLAEADALLKVGQAPLPPNTDTTELAAWTSLCRALLNLSETYERE